ncbi:MAG: hypothetical protein HYU02_05640 [Thaumarchaeota archaeon]|nr:hypothetical protein [Nitrososphaerota archaeon]
MAGFAQGIAVTDYDGNPVTSYAIKELDREDMAFPQNVVSARVYDLTPGEFSGPVKVTLAYPEDYENPEELYVAWWDEENGIWHGVPTTRDAARKTLAAELSHTTKVGAVNCTPGSSPTEVESLQSLVFEQRCGKTIGKAVPGGSEVSGSCIQSIPDPNATLVWNWINKTNALYLDLLPNFTGSVPTRAASTIAAVNVNEEYPSSQLSSPCIIKSWGANDSKSDDITVCKANVSDAEIISLTGKSKEDPDGRCVEVCTEAVKSAYGALYGNLAKSGGDGLVDGSACGCTRNASDLICSKITIANPPTPGYESGIAGGYGVLNFYIKPGGCVVDKDSQGTPDIAAYASDQDNIINIKNSAAQPYKKGYTLIDNQFSKTVPKDKAIAPKHYVINPVENINKNNFISFLKKAGRDNIGLKPEGSDLRAGWNSIYFKVDELQSQGKLTGCAHTWVNVQIKGAGISLSDVEAPLTDLELRLRERCAQLPGLEACDTDEPNRGFSCSGRSLAQTFECDTPRICDAGTKALSGYYYSGIFCYEPESKGCFNATTNLVCVEEGKPEMYYCQNKVRQETTSCKTGNCYMVTKQTIASSTQVGGCGENACIKGDSSYYCDGKKYYKCDGKKGIATDSSGNEIQGECTQDEICVNGANSKDTVCVSSKPKCKEGQIKASDKYGSWFCVDKDYSPEIYTCQGGRQQFGICPTGGTVCIKELGGTPADICGKSPTNDAFCQTRSNGYNCKVQGVSGTLIRCQNRTYAETKENYCYEHFNTPCATSGVTNPNDACKPAQAVAAPLNERDKYICSRQGLPELTYVSADGTQTVPAACDAGQVCNGTSGAKTIGAKKDLCIPKYDYFCTAGPGRLNRPASKVYCLNKGSTPQYYYCNPATLSVVEDSCADSKICTTDNTTVDKACKYASASRCSREGSFCYRYRVKGVGNFYTCKLDTSTQVLGLTEGECSNVCCGSVNQIKCDDECSQCYGGEQNGPGDGKWYVKGSILCTNNSVAVRKCVGIDDQESSWSAWLCTDDEGKLCIEAEGGCIKACTKAQLNNITGKDSGATKEYYLAGKGEDVCVKPDKYECLNTSQGGRWINMSQC